MKMRWRFQTRREIHRSNQTYATRCGITELCTCSLRRSVSRPAFTQTSAPVSPFSPPTLTLSKELLIHTLVLQNIFLLFFLNLRFLLVFWVSGARWGPPSSRARRTVSVCLFPGPGDKNKLVLVFRRLSGAESKTIIMHDGFDHVGPKPYEFMCCSSPVSKNYDNACWA